MKVSDIMHRSVITVIEETPIKEVGRLIFSLGIAGIPVVRGKKIIGIVTEEDILGKMHPTMQELVEDYAHARDFESMAKNMHVLLDASVGTVMNPRVTSVTSDTPLMKAHSLMQINNFSRLPIVNSRNELVGIISQGDIFRSIIRDEIPKLEKERYAGFISRYYDQMVNWEKRFAEEFPTLFKLFEKEKVEKIIDLGVWTGEYTVGLAKKSNYELLGLDHNPIMINMANGKRKKLPFPLQKRLSFALTDFTNINSLVKEKFDAAICMGNSLPYIPVSIESLFNQLSKVLNDDNGMIMLQLLNFEKVMSSKNRLLSFQIQDARDGEKRKQLSMEFLDKKGEKAFLHNTVIFDYDGTNWIYKGITTIEVYNIKKQDVETALKKAGFRKISFSGNLGEYQGDYGELSLEDKFDPENSDWLNVVAKR